MLMLAEVSLRLGTQDVIVYKDVLCENEYRLPDELPPGSVVLDIGAHIGCFALACLARGAARVVCYEADRENIPLLTENLARFGDMVEIHHQAVWRSDRGPLGEPIDILRKRNPIFTAMSQVRESLDRVHPDGRSVGLDEILARLGRVDLLKLDCEGSEYPILYTSQELWRVGEVVGESHEAMPHPDFPGRCNGQGVVDFLAAQGFDATLVSHPDHGIARCVNWFRGRCRKHPHMRGERPGKAASPES